MNAWAWKVLNGLEKVKKKEYSCFHVILDLVYMLKNVIFIRKVIDF